MFRVTLSRCALALAAILTPSFVSEVNASDQEVLASSFGWNVEDSTEALQKAIDSGAKRVVVDKQSGPWIVRPIVLRGDLELVLQEGVEILAKKGEYKKLGDVMFRASCVSNLTIRGEGNGASLRMRKKDYWEAPYEKSEWRHGVSILSSENVTLENLTIAETGGDGIYLGVGKTSPRSVPCKNITIKNVDCVANNRQGVSVISVDGLLIEDCVLCDTIGTAPEAGIDFEPNNKDEQISNVVMRRVKCVNNRGDGIAFYLVNLRENGYELSFTIEDCESVRNARAGLSFQVANAEDAVLDGKMVVRNTDFVGNALGITIRSKWANGAPLSFEDVKLVTPCADKALKYGKYADYDFNITTEEYLEKFLATTYDAGASLIAVGNDVYSNGGIEFKNFNIVDAREGSPEPLMLLRDVSSEVVGYKGLTGNVRSTKLNADGSLRSVSDLNVEGDEFLKRYPQLNVRRVAPYDFSELNSAKGAKISKELAQAWSGDVMTKGGFRVRGGGAYFFYAKSGTKLWWFLQQRKIGNYPLNAVKTTVTAPSGAKQNLEELPTDGKPKQYHYEAAEDGWYKIELEFGASTVELTSEYPVMTAARPNLNVCGTTGAFKFYVPEGAEDLGVRVIGSPAEHVIFTLIDPDGVEAASIESGDELGIWTTPWDGSAKKAAAPKHGFWTIRFDRPKTGILEDYVVTLLGVPALLR